MTNSNRVKYANITGIAGYAVLPEHYSDEDIERVKSLGGAFRNFQPVFVGTITYRACFNVRGDGSIKRSVIVGRE